MIKLTWTDVGLASEPGRYEFPIRRDRSNIRRSLGLASIPTAYPLCCSAQWRGDPRKLSWGRSALATLVNTGSQEAT
jgi:hypothetical protein